MLTFNTFIPKFNNSPIIQPQQRPVSRFNNLAPLPYDTVSFGQSEKNIGNPKFGITQTEAERIHQEAITSGKYLNLQLTNILGDLVAPEGATPTKQKPIEAIHYRIKSPDSIREKSATRRWINSDEVKSNMTDIVGARIILGKTTTDCIDKVLDRITASERDNKLQIIEIENYRPEPEIDEEGNILHSYDYSSPQALRRLKAECDKKGTMISKKDEDVPTGYTAIHLLTKLPNGFTGEIQILGTGVGKLKDIEDLCYKIKSGKSIDKKYKSMEKTLEPLKNKDDVILKREFNNYTRASYIYQRDKYLGRITKGPEYLPIPEYLPPELDFNNLAEQKHQCDEANK